MQSLGILGRIAFGVAAVVLLSNVVGRSQTAESTEAWFRAHNADPVAVGRCVDALRLARLRSDPVPDEVARLWGCVPGISVPWRPALKTTSPI
jgi:hypothetical protein